MNAKAEKWIFVSSPGDVAAERVIADRVFRRLAKEFDESVTLRLVLWEFEPLFAHGNFQRQIRKPSECDLMVTVLWTRLGTRLPAEFSPGPGLLPPTGTEYELLEALEGHARNGRPDVLIYVKKESAAATLDADDIDERRAQFKELKEFCNRLFYDASGASVVAHHGFRDAAEFERKLLEHARKWLREQLDQIDVRPRWTMGSPFRGLRPFDADFRDVFFGRAHALGELIRRLHDVEHPADHAAARARLLLIVGMSGNGKTSLVRAGLLPQLEFLPVEGIAAWDTVSLRPSDVDPAAPDAGPFGAIVALIRDRLGAGAMLGAGVAELARELEHQPAAAVARIEAALWHSARSRRHSPPPAQMRLLIFIDQLEELFTLPGLTARVDAMLAAIVALAGASRIWVVATLRSDFVHRLEGHAELMALLERCPPYTLLPPRTPELADMIREPATAAGLRFEERNGVSLDDEILHEASVNPESLPLLQYALEQLYEQRDGRTLRWDVYRPPGREGGLRGSLVTVAEGLLSASEDEAAFRRVMRELTSVSEDGSATRRYPRLESFREGSAERALLTRLIDARLCVADQQGAAPVVFLAHEALLQSWPRVHRWLVQESSLLRLRDELHRDARAWVVHGRKNDWLGTAPDKLAAIAQLEREALLSSDLDTEFARSSRQRARFNQRLKNGVIASLCVLGLASAVAGVLAVQQRDRARLEATTAERTAAFVTSLFQLADPDENKGNSITVRELLDKGAQEIESTLHGEPQIRASLMATMGQAYKGLGLYAPARKLLEEAVVLRRDSGAADPAALAGTLNQIADLGTVSADFDAAERGYREALAINARTTDRHASEQRAASLSGLGEVLQEKGQYDASRAALEEALALEKRLYPAAAPQTANTQLQLAVTLGFAGNNAAAVDNGQQAVAMYRKLYGVEPHPAFAEALNEVALILNRASDYDGAEKLFTEALAMKRRLFGDRHPSIAIGLNNIAYVQEEHGAFAQAEANYRAALAMERDLLGSKHPRVAETLSNLAYVQQEQGQHAAALATMREALQVAGALHDGDHPEVARLQDTIGFWLTLSGEFAASEREIRQALAMRERLVGRDHTDYALSLLHMAILDNATQRYAQALEAARTARAIFEKRSPKKWRTAAASAAEGRALIGVGQPQAAAPLLKAALATLQADRGTPLDYVNLVSEYLKSLPR